MVVFLVGTRIFPTPMVQQLRPHLCTEHLRRHVDENQSAAIGRLRQQAQAAVEQYLGGHAPCSLGCEPTYLRMAHVEPGKLRSG